MSQKYNFVDHQENVGHAWDLPFNVSLYLIRVTKFKFEVL
jgi:hypothetical protein